MAPQPPKRFRRSLRRPSLLAWLHLLRITRRAERMAAEQLREWELSYAQFDVIAQLGGSEGMTQQELARRLLVTEGNVTQLLDKLERRSLVRRCPEGRTKRVILTPEGRSLFAEAVPAHEEWQAARFAALSDAEQRELLRLLKRLDRAQR
jgi:DNA-binding MarR family transcriptional regulator